MDAGDSQPIFNRVPTAARALGPIGVDQPSTGCRPGCLDRIEIEHRRFRSTRFKWAGFRCAVFNFAGPARSANVSWSVVDKLRGQYALGDPTLRSVNVLQQQIDQSHALAQGPGKTLPLLAVENHRNRIEFPSLRSAGFDQLAGRGRRVIPQGLLGRLPTLVIRRTIRRQV